jgi:hypothetical protein
MQPLAPAATMGSSPSRGGDSVWCAGEARNRDSGHPGVAVSGNHLAPFSEDPIVTSRAGFPVLENVVVLAPSRPEHNVPPAFSIEKLVRLFVDGRRFHSFDGRGDRREGDRWLLDNRADQMAAIPISRF